MKLLDGPFALPNVVAKFQNKCPACPGFSNPFTKYTRFLARPHIILFPNFFTQFTERISTGHKCQNSLN